LSENQQEVLSFEIVIDAKLSDETKKNIEDLKGAREASEEDRITEGMLGLEQAPEPEFSDAELEQIQSTVGDTLGGLDKADLAQFGLLAKNPTALISKSLTRLLGSGAAAVLAPLAIAITAPIVMQEFIKALSVKGGPLNRDWRRFIQNEVAIGLSRVQQKEDEFGVSQTILTQVKGWVPNNENWNYNNLFDVNDERIARIGLSDREAGVTFFTQ